MWLVCIHYDLVCIHYDLVCIHYDLVCMHYDLVCMHYDLVCMHYDLVCIHYDLVYYLVWFTNQTLIQVSIEHSKTCDEGTWHCLVSKLHRRSTNLHFYIEVNLRYEDTFWVSTHHRFYCIINLFQLDVVRLVFVIYQLNKLLVINMPRVFCDFNLNKTNICFNTVKTIFKCSVFC